MNRLRFETSPYLLQHAHNPVHWHAWKPETLERARREGKPILVSIGYSTCHWCHVMERESFEDTEVAAFMNAHFINIKVDREERPDVDHVFMEVCQAISGNGGWPLNCFLTPDGRPFYAGTYYPPAPAYNRPSWLQLLKHLVELTEQDPDKIEAQASRLTALVQQSDRVFTGSDIAVPHPGDFNPTMPYQVYQTLRESFDKTDGGFRGAPKFPDVTSLQFLLEYHFYTGDADALNQVCFSLDKMIRGGIYDQVGGGFARYTVDKSWRVPHFEKMLYDNALLIGLLADVYRLTKNESYKSVIIQTLDFINRELASPEGGFYAALDADSEGVEGKFYVWTWQELQEVVETDSAWFCAYCGATPEGNWEHVNILWRPESDAFFAQEWGMEGSVLEAQLQTVRRKLFKARQRRIRPGLDHKILLDWNALMCTAFAKAYAALGDPAYRDAAERNLTFILNRLKKQDSPGFYHAYANTSDGGRAQINAFLDDYANLIEALFEVYTITFNPFYLRHAGTLIDYIQEEFLDIETQLFFFTAAGQHDLVARKKELFDSATPSGNSTMLRMLLRAHLYFGKKAYQDLALHMAQTMKDGVMRYPASFSRWANALLYLAYPFHEVVITGAEAGNCAQELNRSFFPNKILMVAEQPTLEFPLLAGKGFKHQTTLYVCSNFSCQAPVYHLEEALDLLTPPWNFKPQNA